MQQIHHSLAGYVTCNDYAVLQVCILFIALYLITEGAFLLHYLYMQEALLPFH